MCMVIGLGEQIIVERKADKRRDSVILETSVLESRLWNASYFGAVRCTRYLLEAHARRCLAMPGQILQ